MSEDSSADAPKKKRGRPKGSKNKAKSQKSTDSPPSKKDVVEESLTQEVASESEPVEKPVEAEKDAIAEEIKVTLPADSFTNKRGVEQIFRRDLDEPEFWLTKEGRAPKFTILSADEEQEISRKVEIPTDQIPVYKPENMLSPEFAGTSNYELGVKKQREELKQRLDRLKNDPNASAQEIHLAEEDLKTLEYLYENYNLGMNVFRTAKGGRSKLQK